MREFKTGDLVMLKRKDAQVKCIEPGVAYHVVRANRSWDGSVRRIGIQVGDKALSFLSSKFLLVDPDSLQPILN